MDDHDRLRRHARAAWPVRRYRLGEEPGDDLLAETSVTERLNMVWVLRDRMWDLTGKPWPAGDRHTMPVRVHRR